MVWFVLVWLAFIPSAHAHCDLFTSRSDSFLLQKTPKVQHQIDFLMENSSFESLSNVLRSLFPSGWLRGRIEGKPLELEIVLGSDSLFSVLKLRDLQTFQKVLWGLGGGYYKDEVSFSFGWDQDQKVIREVVFEDQTLSVLLETQGPQDSRRGASTRFQRLLIGFSESGRVEAIEIRNGSRLWTSRFWKSLSIVIPETEVEFEGLVSMAREDQLTRISPSGRAEQVARPILSARYYQPEVLEILVEVRGELGRDLTPNEAWSIENAILGLGASAEDYVALFRREEGERLLRERLRER